MDGYVSYRLESLLRVTPGEGAVSRDLTASEIKRFKEVFESDKPVILSTDVNIGVASFKVQGAAFRVYTPKSGVVTETALLILNTETVGQSFKINIGRYLDEWECTIEVSAPN